MNGNESRCNIFISHIAQDKPIAEIISRNIEKLGVGLIEVNISGNLPEEVDWVEWTREHITQANLLLILLTNTSVTVNDKTRELDWMLFESGMYLSNKSGHELVIIHHPRIDIPGRLKSFRMVSADIQHVTKFLRKLLEGRIISNIPRGLQRLGDRIPEFREDIDRSAKVICEAFPSVPERRIRMLTTSLVLDIDLDSAQDGVIPEGAKVTANAESWRMLGLLEGRIWTWGELMPFLPAEKGWINELALAIQNSANGRVPRPIHQKLEAEDGKVYVPVLYRDEYIPPKTYRVNVVFVPTDDKPIDSNLLFVIMSYREEMESVFEAITNAAKAQGLTAQRVKDVLGDYRITNRIIDMIERAKIIVADLTYERPNVYFELGYARAIGKTVFTTVRQGAEIHFDVKDWTYIPYQDENKLTSELSIRLETELRKDR
jgi:hypothetical protein